MIHTLSDEELKKRLKETLADERQSVRLFLALLIEFDRRRLQEDSPHPSLFSFCIRELGLAEAEAYKRIQTARAAAKFPGILDLLEAGVLHVSAIAVLAPHLKEDTHVVLLERARGLSKRQLEFFVASLSEARPAVRDSIVPVPGAASSRGPACLESAAQGPAGERAVGPASPGGADCCPEPSNSSPRATERIDAPSSQARVAFTADEETLAYIETIRQRLSHRLPAAPSRQLGPLFKAALKALLRQLEPESTERAPRPCLPGRRRVPKWVRRTVWKRDGGRCAFRAADGRRCESRTWLEYDHVVPFALGGASADPGNIRLLCRAHNQRAARLIFGERPPPS